MPAEEPAASSSSKPTASSARRSGTAPAGPATPSSTPMSSSPTWSTAQTASGPLPTAGTSSPGRWPPGPCTSPRCVPSWHRSASPGTCGATAWASCETSRRRSSGRSPSAGSTSKQRWTSGGSRRRWQPRSRPWPPGSASLPVRRRPICCASAGRSSSPRSNFPTATAAPGRRVSTTSPPPSATTPLSHPDPRPPRRSSGSSRARTACRSTTGRSTSSLADPTRPGRCLSPCSDRPSPAGTPSVLWPGPSTSPPTRPWLSLPGLLDRDSVVRVLADPDAGTEHVRTRSGQLVPATSGDRRYTTTELLGRRAAHHPLGGTPG